MCILLVLRSSLDGVHLKTPSSRIRINRSSEESESLNSFNISEPIKMLINYDPVDSVYA
jgi:hypothetical protein